MEDTGQDGVPSPATPGACKSKDTGDDGVSSPATPGAGKSKLDTLSKEDLIKFAKKQIMVLQKVKSRCTDLEKEVETLKSKPVKDETDDVVQALTERLDMVLLEKAETQQQLVSMKKELAKTKQEAENTAKQAAEAQAHTKHSNGVLLKEIEDLKTELLQSKSNYNENVDAVKRELQAALMKQKELTDKLTIHENQDVQLRKLEEELQRVHQPYQDKISSLEKALESSEEEKNTLLTNLKESQANLELCYSEIKTLHADLLNLRTLHNDEVKDLMHQLESSSEQSEQEKLVFQDLIKQYVDKQRVLEEEIKVNNQKNDHEIELLRKRLEENCKESQVLHSEPVGSDDKVMELESQQGLLKDELTYITNLKVSLEKEVEHLKSEYFHERDELEFKINELQLAIEDYNGLTEKLQTELQTTKAEKEQLSQKVNEDFKIMREKHKKELFEVKQTLTSQFENERMSLVHEIQILKDQVDQINHEKEEAVNSYEGLRETFLSLQAELGDSAGKISREFEAMKQQQATDVHELQQKLRAAYKDKNNLLETVNRLQSEVELLSTLQEECEDLKLNLTKLEQVNEEILGSLQQKEKLLQELQSKICETSAESVQNSSDMQLLKEEIEKLQKMYTCEQVKVETLKQEAETYATFNKQLKETVEELTQKLQESENEGSQLTNLKQINDKLVTSLHEKDNLLQDLQQKTQEMTVQVAEKDTLLQDLQQKIQEMTKTCETAAESVQTSSDMQMLKEEIEKLQTLYTCEQVKVEPLKQEAETYATINKQLKDTVDELTQKLQEFENEGSQLTDLKQKNDKLVDSLHEKDNLLQDLQQKTQEMTVQLAEKDTLLQDLQQKTQEMTVQLAENDTLLLDLQQKIQNMTVQQAEMSTSIECSKEEYLKLRELYQSEETKALNFQTKVDEQETLNAQLKHSVEELTHKLQELISNNDRRDGEMVKSLQEQIDLLTANKEKLEGELKKCQDEASVIQEEKEVISRDFARLVCEHSGCENLKDELDNLRIKLQMASEAKDRAAVLLEQKELAVKEFRTQLCVLQDSLAVECTDQDVSILLQGINDAVLQLKDEKQKSILLKEETSVQLDRLQNESDAQCSELRALLSDYSKEKVLLKGELEETLADKEALQKDLLEMKIALEKSKLENQELLLRIENVTVDLNSTQENNNAVNKEGKQDDLNPSVIENEEAAHSALKIEHESVQKKESGIEYESLLAELQKKIEGLEKDCKEREEKSNKIKAVAVKAKKELDANKKEVQSLRKELERVRAEKEQITSSMKDVVQGAESYQNLLVAYDKQTELLENEKERANSAENRLEEVSQQLRAAYQEHEKLSSVNEDIRTRMETLQANNRLLEGQILEMQRANTALDKELEAEKLVKEQKIKDHTVALKQSEELQAQLQQEKMQLQKITQEFELLKKDARKSSLMDMEIADYERLVKELNQKLTHKTSQLEDLEQEIGIQKQKQETLLQEISSLQATIEQHEERSTKMKQLLVKTKKELSDSKQAESDHLILQASLKGELEANQQHVEAYKIQVSELTSEKHKVQEQLRTLTDQHQRAANSYQQRLLALQEECTAAKAEQAAVSAEFESYKVRVHNVLKQQKNKSASQAEHEVFKQEREHLQSMIDQLKNKLQDAQHSVQMSTAELHTLQSEHDMLLEKHNKMLQETVTKEAELREKLCALQSENMVLKTEHAQVVSQLSAQNEAQRNSFRDQVRRLQDDHRKTVETLQQQMSKVEAQLFQAKSEISVTSSHQPAKSLRDRRPTDLPLLDLYSAREEGEGMETTDTDSISSASTHIASLEQLLNSSDIKTEPPQWQPELTKEDLTEKLNTASKSVDHLSVLLRETEATNAMLMEQITLLKNEIRRLERNQEREKSVANLEYLKNVLLQFIFLKPGSERERLLPVINTMLQLSPDEKGKLHAIAQGEEDAAARPAGWASYLHSWSGLR